MASNSMPVDRVMHRNVQRSGRSDSNDKHVQYGGCPVINAQYLSVVNFKLHALHDWKPVKTLKIAQLMNFWPHMCNSN